jgi:hypothetical protein
VTAYVESERVSVTGIRVVNVTIAAEIESVVCVGPGSVIVSYCVE